jgi:hypothetical protein
VVTFLRCPDLPPEALRPPAGPTSVVLPLAGPVGPGLADGLCAVVHATLGAASVDVLTCDATGVPTELGLLDALARMLVTARRAGCGLRVRGAAPGLRALIELAGLAEVLSVDVDEGG